jgi:hypothetical protein
MLRASCLAFASIGLIAAIRAGPPQAAGNAAPTRITANDFEFMSGSWQSGSVARVVEEHWTLPKGGTLLGMSRTVAGGKTSAFEFPRLEETRDGVDYVAQPGGRPPTRFRCTSVENRKAVFENPQHDFPTKIVYERVDDELIATVSGPENPREKPQQFRFSRAGDEVRLPD